MVTWDELTDLERADLRFLVKSGTGAIYKPRQVRLTALGLIAGDGLFSTPTDAGRALVASVDAGAGDDNTIATLRQQVDTLRVALQPFADVGGKLPKWFKEPHLVYVANDNTLTITPTQLRAAAKALQAGESGEGE